MPLSLDDDSEDIGNVARVIQQDMPPEVEAAYLRLVEAGFTSRLI